MWASPWRLATVALIAVNVATLAFLLLDVVGLIGDKTSEVRAIQPSAETLAAVERARETTEFKRTLLLSKGAPQGVGVGSDVFTSLPRVETLGELKWLLTDDVGVIVIDASAQKEPGLEDFIYEQWKAGRPIVGLNACFMNVPEKHDRNDPDPGRCISDPAWRGDPYATYLLPGWSTDPMDFARRFEAAGGRPPQQIRGGAALLKESPHTACFPRRMLAHLESGAPGSFPGKCVESE